MELFLGVLFSYGLVGPIAAKMGGQINDEVKCFHCIKIFLLTFSTGAAPQLAVEYARRTLSPAVKPSFLELDNIIRKNRRKR